MTVKTLISRNWLCWLIAFVVAFDVAFAWQKITGAYDSEFGGHPDEAAHYVTGLFVRDAAVVGFDYARGGFHGSPMKVGKEYADNFYEHYPKVALGVWPPAFYVVQTAWTLPFGASRFSVLLLMAALAGLVATVLYAALRKEFGEWPAAAAALLWLCGPTVRESYGMVMAEMLCTLTMFGATLAWGRFLNDGRKRDAVFFALLASAAILTKGTGIALVLMCAFSLLAARRWQMLKRPALWMSALGVAILAGPWTWVFRETGRKAGGWVDNSGHFSWAFTQHAAPYYVLKMSIAIGIAVAVVAVIGLLARCRFNGRWAALAGLVIAVFLFQCAVPVGYEARHIISATPAIVMFAVAGLYSVARSRFFAVRGPEQQRREHIWVLLLLLLTLPFAVQNREPKGYSGFQALASDVLEKSKPATRILVSSDARGEGMFISEVAMRDQRPNLIIERASKSLVAAEGRTWDGKNQRSKFDDDDKLLDYLKQAKIEYIVLDNGVPENKRVNYHDQLHRVITDNIGLIWPISESQITRANEIQPTNLKLYRIVNDR